MINFNEKKGFICDMDGVIYHGNKILPGVTEFIQWLHEEEKEFLFLTNNSGCTPKELQQKLARMGLDVTEDHFYTSALATAAFLKEQAPGCSVYVIGEAADSGNHNWFCCKTWWQCRSMENGCDHLCNHRCDYKYTFCILCKRAV